MQFLFTRTVPDEINREREFYRVRGLPYPKELPLDNGKLKEEDSKEKSTESDCHRFDEQVKIKKYFTIIVF